MFLSKDFLDEGAADFQQAAAGLTAPAPRGAFGQPGGSYASSGMARPPSSAGRPATASSLNDQGGEDGDDHATPTSAATLRQKMLQQRQRALQKQRSGAGAGPVAASSMVMANDHLPTSDARGPAPPTPSGMGGSRPATAGSMMDPNRVSAGMPPPRTASTSATLEPGASSMSLGEAADNSGVVMPVDMPEEDTKEAEARRRTTLAQELDERGITPIFDPTPSGGPTGREVQFDVGQIAPPEMRSFLLNPAPKNGGMIECRIIRERCGLNKLFPKYTMESDAGVFMMAAKKQKHNKTSNYAVSMNRNEIGKEGDGFIGKLRSNFLGLEFVAYGAGLNPKKIDPNMSQVHAIQLARQEMVAIQYSSSLWGGTKPRGPRKMSAVIPRVLPNGERMVCRTLNSETEGLVAMQKAGNTAQTETFSNKPPKWNEQIGAFVLNFNKRVTQASVKNFQFTNADDPDTVFLQFGRVGKDVFNVDFRYPFSPFQAFAICLSSFDYKLCCE
eukprot:TRINITY_DN29599_c0_g1_i1.p1 TRINITY_DN29599_c0_g1~~TRINITY_DN29599_c0_g1_i1.p1  ORF type:complete len:501 (+),score=84.90 TRINITY_DN29599_c0_g1_i1:98-1600(+)